MPEHLVVGLVQRSPIVTEMAQGQGAIPAPVDVEDLNVGLAVAKVVLVRQRLAQGSIAGLFVNSRDLEGFLPVVVAATGTGR